MKNTSALTLAAAPVIHHVPFQEDGFVTTAAEPWFKVKVQVIQHYFRTFVTHASEKAEDIIFVDLFAGSGLYTIGHQRELFAGSSLASLQHDLPVSKWVFCEPGPENTKALKIRVNKYFRGKNVVILESKPENVLEKFQYYIPQSKGAHKVAVFCVVDPFSVDIPLPVLDQLNSLGFSFLIPYTFSLNSHVDYKFYLKEHRERMVRYLGPNVDGFFEGVKSNAEFYKRLVRAHQNSMLMLGLNASLSVHKLDSGLMEMPMYYIGMYSRLLPSKVIQREVQASLHQQMALF